MEDLNEDKLDSFHQKNALSHPPFSNDAKFSRNQDAKLTNNTDVKHGRASGGGRQGNQGSAASESKPGEGKKKQKSKKR